MPRKPRMYLPGIPCHIIQHGNNRDAAFFAEQDYQFYGMSLFGIDQRAVINSNTLAMWRKIHYDRQASL